MAFDKSRGAPMKTLLHVAVALTLAGPAFAQASPPVEALDGLDPVLLVQGREVQGKSVLKAVHGQFEYLFSSPETKATFEREPDRYSIQLGGVCARMGKSAGGNPSDYLVHDGRIYIFGSDACHKKFAEAPEKYLPKPAAPFPTSVAAKKDGARLVERAVAALGGAARLDAVNTYVETATQKQRRGDVEIPVTVKTMWRVPDAVRAERSMESMGQQMTSAMLMTPAGAWFMARGQAFPINSAGRPGLELDFGRNPLILLRHRKDAAFKAAALQQTSADGAKVDQVRIVNGAVDVVLRLDAATGRVHSVVFVDRNLEGEFGTMALAYSDFRNEEGLQLPYVVTGSFNGEPNPNMSLTLTSIAVNPPLDAALFQPVGK
jgi:YHS domain-containing protein